MFRVAIWAGSDSNTVAALRTLRDAKREIMRRHGADPLIDWDASEMEIRSSTRALHLHLYEQDQPIEAYAGQEIPRLLEHHPSRALTNFEGVTVDKLVAWIESGIADLRARILARRPVIEHEP